MCVNVNRCLSPVASTIGWTRASNKRGIGKRAATFTGYLLLTIQEEEADHLEFKRQLCAPRQRNEARQKEKPDGSRSNKRDGNANES